MMSSEINKNFSPNLILILSGKRKTGKDYVSARLDQFIDESLSPRCSSFRHVHSQKIVLAAHLKRIYADRRSHDHVVDYDQLLDSTDYKENHRLGLIAYIRHI